MKFNVGTVDRALRIVAGLVLIALAATGVSRGGAAVAVVISSGAATGVRFVATTSGCRLPMKPVPAAMR